MIPRINLDNESIQYPNDKEEFNDFEEEGNSKKEDDSENIGF